MPKRKTVRKGTGSTTRPKRRAARPKSGRVNVTHVPKPWGHETIWAHSERYVGKILHINAGHELSVQYHNRKDETVYLLWGEIIYRVQRDGDDILDDVQLNVGESFRITPGTIHQMIAVTDCDVLEVSTPEVDDIVRLSDKYGREGTTEP
jgi:mannose-6-phosphate isomerase